MCTSIRRRSVRGRARSRRRSVRRGSVNRAPSSPFHFDAGQVVGDRHDGAFGRDRSSARECGRGTAAPRAARDRYVAPRSEIERDCSRGMWAETLQLDRVGVFDDFFELGGSSLQATMLVNRLQKALGRSFESIIVFDAPTVAWSRRALRASKPARHRAGCARRSALVPASGEGRLSSAQQRLWFLDQFNPGSTVYNERRAIRLRGSLRRRRARGCARRPRRATRVLAHDVSERSRTCRSSGSSLADAARFRSKDLTSLSATERKCARPLRLVADRGCPAVRPRRTGPLFRAGLVRLAADDHVLWLVFHHIVADGCVGRASSCGRSSALYRAAPGVRAQRRSRRCDIQYLEFAVLAARTAGERAAGGAAGVLAGDDSPTRPSWSSQPITPGRRSSRYRGSSVPVVDSRRARARGSVGVGQTPAGDAVHDAAWRHSRFCSRGTADRTTSSSASRSRTGSEPEVEGLDRASS